MKGRPDYVLAEKFKMLKATIQDWSKYNRGNWKQKKDNILNEIPYRETVREQSPLTDDELVQKKANSILEFEEVAKKEEIDWKQRSKVQWSKHGDINTVFPQNCNFSQEIQLHGAIRSGWYYYPVSR